MITISQIVRELIADSPLLTDVLISGIGNQAEIARQLKPKVEKRAMEEVSVGAVAMALGRVTKDLQVPQHGHGFLTQLDDITVKSGLVEVVFKNSKEISKIQATLLNEREAHPNFFYNLTQGLYETILIISGEHYEAIKNQLAIVDVVREEGNLSLVTIRLPDTSLPVPGVYYPILRALAWEGISFVEIVSVSTELSILFEDSVVDRAFSVIKRMTSEG